jgi:protein arginine kinase activator
MKISMKQCEECGLNPANVHLTQIVDNESRSFHMCEECAKKKGIHIVIGEQPAVNAPPHEASFDPADERECGVCHKKLSEFRTKGRLGCVSCYSAFEDEIDELLCQVHGAKEHKGKQYRRSPEPPPSASSISDLRTALERAVKNEHFERAAAIRDTITALKGISGT